MTRTLALLLALAGCTSSTAPRPALPLCRDVIHVAAGDLYLDGSALRDGVLTCRATL